MVQSGLVRSGSIRFGLVRSGMVWFLLVLFGQIILVASGLDTGLVWFGLAGRVWSVLF